MSEHFLLSRTDAIGDVILSLPVAAALKKKYPDCKITWIGRTYTQPIISAAENVDAFLNYDEWIKLEPTDRILKLMEQSATSIIHIFPRKELAIAAKEAGIPVRIGTSHRIFHWRTCTKLIPLGRKKSDLHEAQLNLRLCTPLGIDSKPLIDFTIHDIHLKASSPLPEAVNALLDKNKIRVVLHPGSQGSAREWGTANFLQLIKLLPHDKFQLFVTGTADEGKQLSAFLAEAGDGVINLTGQLTLDQLITFYSECTGIVAASTGPLHIMAGVGNFALGIFPPIRPMHPGRWAPLGPKASTLCADKNCSDCRTSPKSCACMQLIVPSLVAKQLQTWA